MLSLPFTANKPSSWMLPMLLAVFLLCVLPSYSLVFNATTRWVFLIFGLAYVILISQPFYLFRTNLAVSTLLLLLWPMTTAIWSLNPGLSLLKSALFVVVVVTMFTLGALWAQRESKHTAYAFMPILVVFAITIFISGIPKKIATGYGGLYESAGNPNLTGLIAIFCLPLILQGIFSAKPSNRKVWWIALIFIAYITLATLSRSAILVAGFISLGWFFGLGIKRGKIFVAALSAGVILVSSMLLFMPEKVFNATDYLYRSVIMKGALERDDISDSLLASRSVPFLEQLRAANEGGVLGAGYGIQIEVGHYRIVNDIAVYDKPDTYKREKGNSALAIIEEQGVVGLVLTLFWYLMLFRYLIRDYRLMPQGDNKLLMGMLIGLLLGMVIHSMFEAWWVSPGSFESLMFWAIAGIAYGMGRRSRQERFSRLTHAT